MPGVSTNIICSLSVVYMQRTALRVVCGFGETAATFSPSSAFIIEDLPTLGTPTIIMRIGRLSMPRALRFSSRSCSSCRTAGTSSFKPLPERQSSAKVRTPWLL